MCARYTLYHPVGLLAAHFAALSDGLAYPAGPEEHLIDNRPPESHASYNIAPTEQVVVVLEDGSRVLRFMKWGLIPRWAGQTRAMRPLVNARAETLSDKPSFREAVRMRRCIVPASGFYEWKKAGRERLPYYISRGDGGPMAFAALWEPAASGITTDPPTCAVVTVPANKLISTLHDRMPAILGHDEEAAWLDVDSVDASAALSLLRPCPVDWLQMHPVSPRVNRQAVNDPECITFSEHATSENLSLFGADW